MTESTQYVEPTRFTESNVFLAVVNDDLDHARELISHMFEMERLALHRAAEMVQRLVDERDAQVTAILRQAALEHQDEIAAASNATT